MVIEEIESRVPLVTEQAFYTQFLYIIFHILPTRRVWSQVFRLKAFIVRNIVDFVAVLFGRSRPAAAAIAHPPTSGKAMVHSFSSQARFWAEKLGADFSRQELPSVVTVVFSIGTRFEGPRSGIGDRR